MDPDPLTTTSVSGKTTVMSSPAAATGAALVSCLTVTFTLAVSVLPAPSVTVRLKV